VRALALHITWRFQREDPRERVGPGLPAEWQRAKANGPVPPRPRAVLSTPFNRAAD